MKFKINLHGLPMKKAIIKAESVLIEASFDKNMECEIINDIYLYRKQCL